MPTAAATSALERPVVLSRVTARRMRSLAMCSEMPQPYWSRANWYRAVRLMENSRHSRGPDRSSARCSSRKVLIRSLRLPGTSPAIRS